MDGLSWFIIIMYHDQNNSKYIITDDGIVSYKNISNGALQQIKIDMDTPPEM